MTDNPLTGKPPAGNQSQYNNNNKYSIEECNNNQSINQSDSDSMDRQTDIKHYKELIADNIKLDWLLEVAGRNSESEVAMVMKFMMLSVIWFAIHETALRLKIRSILGRL